MHQYRRQPGLDYKTITALAGRLAAQLLRNANAVLMASNDVVRNNGSISSPYMAFTCLRRGVFFSHRNWENPFYIPTIMGGLTHITYFEF